MAKQLNKGTWLMSRTDVKQMRKAKVRGVLKRITVTPELWRQAEAWQVYKMDLRNLAQAKHFASRYIDGNGWRSILQDLIKHNKTLSLFRKLPK